MSASLINRKIKVLHVVLSLEPGGMENGVVNVANRLDPERFDVGICCLTERGDFANRLRPEVDVTVLGKRPGFDTGLIPRLRKLLTLRAPDILHTHNLGPLIYTALAGVFLPGRILHGEHAQLPGDEKRGKRLWQRKLFYRACAGVHTVSRGLEEELLALGLAAGKSAVVVNGVDTERFAPVEAEQRKNPRREQGLPEEGLVIGIVGRFGPFKRHVPLIEAFNRVAVERPDLRLLIVGGQGPEQERVEQAISASPVRSQILAAGYRQDVRPFYQMMDVLAVPSENEGLSNAVLEAMACGTPVLAHTACGNAEVLEAGRTGFLEDLGSVENLVAGLERVITQRAQLPEMGNQARAEAVETLGIDSMVDGYARLYQNIFSAPESGANCRTEAGQPEEHEMVGTGIRESGPA